MKTTITAALCLSLTSAALAQTEHIDALLMINPDGELVTGLVDVNMQQALASEQRIYNATFDIIPLGGGLEASTTDIPGFNALLPSNDSIPAGYSTLPPSTPVSFNALAFEINGSTSNLWFWDGVGPVSFSPATVVTNVSKAPSVIFSADLDGSSNDVRGFVIDTTNSSGGLHRHVDFTINNSQLAPRGFYLWSFELFAGALQTEPVYFVHALGSFDQSVYDAAVAFVEEEILTEQPICVADFDGDGDVDLGDFGVFGSAFGSSAGDMNYNAAADFDEDGDVDLGDFGVFGGEFGNDASVCSP